MMPWLVHLLTASSAIFALLAVRATAAGDVREAFAWLALTTAIDSVDGALARAARVKARTPGLDGARLDDIVDYLTFVFVPAWIVVAFGLVPERWALAVAGAMLLSSAYGFSQTAAKSEDYFFTGFPSYWNIVVLYLVAIGSAPAFNAFVLLVLAVLVFVPIGYVYPSRTPSLRALTVGLGLLWGVAMLAILWQLPAPSTWLVYASLLYPCYYVILSLALHTRRAG